MQAGGREWVEHTTAVFVFACYKLIYIASLGPKIKISWQ